MKKIKVFILPFALVLGLLSVVFLSAFTTQTKKTKTTDNFYWFDELGVYTEHYTDKTSEMIETECPDTGENICENGYTDEDFNTYGEPETGLNDEAEPGAVILKQ